MPIQLDQITFTYMPVSPQQVKALDDISLTIRDGEFVGIMGHTGSGKTTLIHLLSGLLSPQQGRVLLDGEDIHGRGYDRSQLHQKVGIVFQYPEYQLFETTVERDVAFGLKHSGLSRSEVLHRVQWALETMGFSFEAIRSQSPLALSGGEKRRVAIAGVLAMRPKILIFDEPIAGLDPMGREAFLKLIESLNEAGTTIIVVSHNADALGEYAKRLVVLRDGRIVLDGTAGEVFSDIGRMQQMHLGVSTPRQVADMLYQQGLRIPQDITGYRQLLASLTVQLKGGGEP